MNSPQADGHLPARFPHSEISGSKPVSGSPELIAAVHVLHRLWLPRHPPYALRSLTLSLRHASRSRAGFDSRKSSHVRLFVSLLSWTIRSTETSFDISSRYSIVNERWQGLALPVRNRHVSAAANEIRCGADRDRTDDLRLAKPALSQLSYSPVGTNARHRVGQGRVELPTSRLSGVRSNHLSYWPGQVAPARASLP